MIPHWGQILIIHLLFEHHHGHPTEKHGYFQPLSRTPTGEPFVTNRTALHWLHQKGCTIHTLAPQDAVRAVQQLQFLAQRHPSGVPVTVHNNIRDVSVVGKRHVPTVTHLSTDSLLTCTTGVTTEKNSR